MDDASIERLHAAIWRGKRRGMLGCGLAVLLWCATFFGVAKFFAPLDRSWGVVFGVLFFVGGFASMIFGVWASVRGHRLRCPGCQADICEELDVEDGLCPSCGEPLVEQRLLRW